MICSSMLLSITMHESADETKLMVHRLGTGLDDTRLTLDKVRLDGEETRRDLNQVKQDVKETRDDIAKLQHDVEQQRFTPMRSARISLNSSSMVNRIRLAWRRSVIILIKSKKTPSLSSMSKSCFPLHFITSSLIHKTIRNGLLPMRLYNAAASEHEHLVYPPTMQIEHPLLPRTRAELTRLTGNYCCYEVPIAWER